MFYLDHKDGVPLVPNGLIFVRLAAWTTGKQATRLFANRKLNIHRHVLFARDSRCHYPYNLKIR